jgi:hypothetical protein
MTVGATGLALTPADAEFGAEAVGEGVAAGFDIGAEEILAGGAAEVAGEFAAELDLAAGAEFALPDLGAGAAMLAGALEATMGLDDEGALFAGELGVGETEFGEAGVGEFPERER